jgi:two-component sensor histidine kinase
MPDGRVALRSNMSGAVLRFEWREAGGPPVTPPTSRGFGLRLLSSALEQFGGGTEMIFEPSGLIYRMHLELPADARPNPLGHDGDRALPVGTTQPAAH